VKKKKLKVNVVAGMLVITFALLPGCGGSTNSIRSPSTSSTSISSNPSNTNNTSSENKDGKQNVPATPASAGDQINGKKLFTANCMACHGDGDGGHNGPSLTESKITKDRSLVVKQITDGGKTMPPFKGTLTDQQIQDLAAYITEVIAKK
jgi:mono/diheme cytochrome c family protein